MKKIYILLVFINLLLPAGIFSQYLKVSPNGRFLVQDNGEPFLWPGDTAWEMFYRLDQKEIEHCLHNRTGKGLTLIFGENLSGSSDHLQATRDGTPGKNDASYIFVYLPVYRSFKINTAVIPGKKLRIWWYDPRTGQAFPQGLVENKGSFNFSNWQDLIKENQAGPDWVVVIDDAEAQYANPGVISAK